MIKSTKLMLCGLLLTIASCGSYDVISYETAGKKHVIKSKDILKNITNALEQYPANRILEITNDSMFFDQILISHAVDLELFIAKSEQLSNFSENPEFINAKKNLTNVVAYRVAGQKGNDKLQKYLDSHTMEFVEISRIMIVDNSNNIDVKALFEEIKSSDDPKLLLAQKAGEISEEPIGAQNEGYLGFITEELYPDIKEIFKHKKEGLYPKIIEGEFGQYIVYMHSKPAKFSFTEAQEKGLSVSRNEILQKYIAENVALLYEDLSNSIKIGNTIIPVDEITPQTKILQIFKKKYSLQDVQNLVTAFLPDEKDNRKILDMIAPSGMLAASESINFFVATLMEYKPSLKNTKEAKELIFQEEQNLIQQYASPALEVEISKLIDTNVIDSELQEFYNQYILPQNPQETPFGKLTKDEKEMVQSYFLQSKRGEAQQKFAEQLRQEFNVTLNEKNIEKLKKEFIKIYEKKAKEEAKAIESYGYDDQAIDADFEDFEDHEGHNH